MELYKITVNMYINKLSVDGVPFKFGFAILVWVKLDENLVSEYVNNKSILQNGYVCLNPMVKRVSKYEYIVDFAFKYGNSKKHKNNFSVHKFFMEKCWYINRDIILNKLV